MMHRTHSSFAPIRVVLLAAVLVVPAFLASEAEAQTMVLVEPESEAPESEAPESEASTSETQPLEAPEPEWSEPSSNAAIRVDRTGVGETPQARNIHHMDQGLVSAGTVLLSVGWTLNTVGALAAESLIQDGNLGVRYALSFIPVAGPIIWGAWVLNTDRDGFAYFAFGDAALQIAGFAMLIAGWVGVDEPLAMTEGVRVVPRVSARETTFGVEVTF